MQGIEYQGKLEEECLPSTLETTRTPTQRSEDTMPSTSERPQLDGKGIGIGECMCIISQETFLEDDPHFLNNFRKELSAISCQLTDSQKPWYLEQQIRREKQEPMPYQMFIDLIQRLLRHPGLESVYASSCWWKASQKQTENTITYSNRLDQLRQASTRDFPDDCKKDKFYLGLRPEILSADPRFPYIDGFSSYAEMKSQYATWSWAFSPLGSH